MRNHQTRWTTWAYVTFAIAINIKMAARWFDNRYLEYAALLGFAVALFFVLKGWWPVLFPLSEEASDRDK